MKNSILKNIKLIQKKYPPEGFLILGVFGSYARGEETSESDLGPCFDSAQHSLN